MRTQISIHVAAALCRLNVCLTGPSKHDRHVWREYIYYVHSFPVHYIVNSTETSLQTLHYCTMLSGLKQVFWSVCPEESRTLFSVRKTSSSPLLLQSVQAFLSSQCMLGSRSVSRLRRRDVNLSVFTGAFAYRQQTQAAGNFHENKPQGESLA